MHEVRGSSAYLCTCAILQHKEPSAKQDAAKLKLPSDLQQHWCETCKHIDSQEQVCIHIQQAISLTLTAADSVFELANLQQLGSKCA